jgi:hypothetical protein
MRSWRGATRRLERSRAESEADRGVDEHRAVIYIFGHSPYVFQIIRTSLHRGFIMSTPANLPRRTAQQLHAPRVIAYALLFAAGAPAVYATEHTLMPSPQTVHIGYFLSSVKPVLAIDSGDIVTIESAASIVPSVIDQSGAVPPSAVPQYQRDIYGEVKDRGPGPHILTGPIEVRGAEPGARSAHS